MKVEGLLSPYEEDHKNIILGYHYDIVEMYEDENSAYTKEEYEQAKKFIKEFENETTNY
jgi:hypothetical protein